MLHDSNKNKHNCFILVAVFFLIRYVLNVVFGMQIFVSGIEKQGMKTPTSKMCAFT